MSISDRITLLLATGFNLGRMPVASGTFGSLLGLPLVLALMRLDWWWQSLVAATLAVCAVPICDTAERLLGGKKDDGRIVADEWMLLPISFIGLPIAEAWWLLPFCWVATRVFDIVKLPPANALQRLQGGAGIVIDDFFAALYALAANHLIYHFLK